MGGVGLNPLNSLDIVSEDKPVCCWWLNANPKIWKYEDLEPNEYAYYSLYNENGHKRRIFKYFLEAQRGDIVIGYEGYPVQKIIALGYVCQEHDNDNLYFRFPIILKNPLEYSYFKSFDELKNLESVRQPTGSLFAVSDFESKFLLERIIEFNPELAGLFNHVSRRYWTYSPGDDASLWEECFENNIMLLGWGDIGDLSEYSSREEIRQKIQMISDNDGSCKNSSLATWQFANHMKIGDIVFAKQGMSSIVGRGIVVGDYSYDGTRLDSFKHSRRVEWTHNGNWDISQNRVAQKTLTDVTENKDFICMVNRLLGVEDESAPHFKPYSKQDFLSEVYMDESSYDNLVSVLKIKKNIILQGAPGVGKTFAAKKLAYSLMGVVNDQRVSMVQFHQSYSYEDFIMGFRPTENGFELRSGAFYNFCKKAEEDRNNDYFFIIDEINRGNLSKIFGELFMLIENDKRNQKLQLLYSDEEFSVPDNLFIIGLMNTADRGLAMVDYALRRRFAFIDLKPAFDSDGFIKYQNDFGSEKFNRLITVVKALNDFIVHDDSLGDGFCIGHSYFCNLSLENVDTQGLAYIVNYEIAPLLKEYWFDEPAKVSEWTSKLRGAIK